MPMPHHRYRPYDTVDLPDRAWPNTVLEQAPDLVLDRPARRQPGVGQPDGRRAQAALLRVAARARLQGDRGGLPRCVEDGLRLRAHARRGGPDPRRRDHRSPHAGAARADRADIRIPRRCVEGDRASLQLDVDDAAAGRLRPRQGGHHHARRARDRHVQAARARERRRHHVRVLAGELPPHGARVRARDLRSGRGRMGPDATREDDREPADDGRALPPERLRRSHRVVCAQLLAARRRASCRSTRTTTAARPSRRRSSA